MKKRVTWTGEGAFAYAIVGDDDVILVVRPVERGGPWFYYILNSEAETTPGGIADDMRLAQDACLELARDAR